MRNKILFLTGLLFLLFVNCVVNSIDPSHYDKIFDKEDIFIKNHVNAYSFYGEYFLPEDSVNTADSLFEICDSLSDFYRFSEGRVNIYHIGAVFAVFNGVLRFVYSLDGTAEISSGDSVLEFNGIKVLNQTQEFSDSVVNSVVFLNVKYIHNGDTLEHYFAKKRYNLPLFLKFKPDTHITCYTVSVCGSDFVNELKNTVFESADTVIMDFRNTVSANLESLNEILSLFQDSVEYGIVCRSPDTAYNNFDGEWKYDTLDFSLSGNKNAPFTLFMLSATEVSKTLYLIANGGNIKISGNNIVFNRIKLYKEFFTPLGNMILIYTGYINNISNLKEPDLSQSGFEEIFSFLGKNDFNDIGIKADEFSDKFFYCDTSFVIY